MLAGLEGEGAGATHLFEGFGVYLGFESTLELLPCPVVAGEECLVILLWVQSYGQLAVGSEKLVR